MRVLRKESREEYERRTGCEADKPWELFVGSGPEDYGQCLHCGGWYLLKEALVDPADGLPICPTAGCDANPLDFSSQGWGV